jgi:hypothetical protein
MMARKKGVVSGLQDYGSKHPYVTLALAGTFSYYLYESMVKPKKETPKGPNMYSNATGIGMTTSTSTTSSSSHGVPGMLDGSTGEMSMDIDPTKSGLFGLGATPVRPMEETTHLLSQQTFRPAAKNPPSFLKYDQTQQLSGFSPSARRRVGHAGMGMASDSYSPTLDTQFENREAMMMGDLRKHQDILGFSGLMPLAGGDWYE